MSTPPQHPEPTDDSLVKENRAFWREVGKEMVKTSINATEEVAKQIIAVASILAGLYFNAIAFGDLIDTNKYPAYLLKGNLTPYLAPVGLLLISLTLAFLVFFPRRYTIDIQSSEAVKRVYTRLATRKLWLVRLSAIFLTLGVFSIGNAAYIYLAYR
jgi:hypothetical protein